MSQRFPKKSKGARVTHRTRWRFAMHLNVFAPWMLWPLVSRVDSGGSQTGYRLTVLMFAAELLRYQEKIEQIVELAEETAA